MKSPRLSLWRRSLSQMKEDLWLQVVAISTLSLCLFIMGVGLLAYHGTEQVLQRISLGAGLRLVLSEDMSSGQSLTLADNLGQWPEVEKSSYIGQDEALLRLGRRLGQSYNDLMAGLTDNPLPAVIELRLAPEADLAELKIRLNQLGGIVQIIEARPWLERLETLQKVVRGAIVVIGAVLFSALALVVTNTMRLAVYARREQLAILDMLGASRAYLRGPFVVESLLQALLAAALSYGLLSFCLYFIPMLPETPLWLSMLLPASLPFFIPLSLFAMAILAGLLGSWLGVGRALRMPELA